MLSNNKNYLNSIPREHTRRKVIFKHFETVRQSNGTKKELNPNNWKPWSKFRPEDSNKINFAGNYLDNAAARNIAIRKARWEQA